MSIISEHSFDFINTNGVTLHVLKAGNPENELIILLHGFPEFWRGWENQVDAMVEAGYYVLVPDQRGYNKSNKPWFIGSYRVDQLAADVIGLIDSAGKDKAFLAGHDWGAAVAWYAAAHYPDRIRRLLIVNVPHSSVMTRTLRTDPEQRKKSTYMFQFQFPILPQWLLRRKNFEKLEEKMVESSNVGTFPEDRMKLYKEAWSNRRAIPCMLNWYRAAFRRRPPVKEKIVKVPTLIIWGEYDEFLKIEMAEQSLKYCEDGTVEVVEGATHWVLHERPEIVNPIIIEFFSKNYES